MGRKTIIGQLESFREEVSRETSITRMILFGSRALGTPHRDSDIDLLVVSPTFQKQRRLERGVNLYLKWNLDYPVDFICLTPEEFKRRKKNAGFIQHIARKGIVIKAS